MTIDSTARTGATWPGLDVVPTGTRAAVSAVVARRLFSAAVHRLPVTVNVMSPDGRRQVLGQGGPTMTVRRPDEFFARLGRHGLIGFGEAFMTGGLGRRGPRRLPDRARRGPADPDPVVAAEGARPRGGPPAA